MTPEEALITSLAVLADSWDREAERQANLIGAAPSKPETVLRDAASELRDLLDLHAECRASVGADGDVFRRVQQ